MYDHFSIDLATNGIPGPVPKKDMKKIILFIRDQIFPKDAHCSENIFLVHEFFFVRLLVFEIWANFVYGQPYTK